MFTCTYLRTSIYVYLINYLISVVIHSKNAFSKNKDNLCKSITIVINESDDVTICEGEGAVFICVLNSSIRSDDVQWYRFIKDTNTTVMVDPNGENINFLTTIVHVVTISNGNVTNNGSTVNNASTALINNEIHENRTNSSLTITDAKISYTGYFWVGTPSLNVCNVSLTVGKSMFVCYVAM